MANGERARFFTTSRVAFFALALLLTSLPSLLFIDLLYRTTMNGSKIVLIVLFVILIANVAWGATHAIVGFCLRRVNARFGVIEASLDNVDKEGIELASCAIALPIYNEDPKRVFAGIRTMYESLQRTGRVESFDIFILSDSTSPERWVQEEEAWATMCRDLDAFGRINYRRRAINKDRKAGNLHEFCEDWGGRYRYMLTLDADSVMSGEDIVKLSMMMELNPKAGLIQTAPRVVYGESLWGRVQQFANRFYGAIFMDGLNFWQQGGGNYWGHNAIIRMSAFMEFCALPDLPGKEPFGGKILSHDFVEAALMQKAGYEVWLAREIGGTYEEGPQDVAEHVKRDRRWCQGNLQHIWLLFSKGLMPTSRVHLANGIMSYASSLFWLLFLALGGIVAYNHERSELTLFPVPGFTNVVDVSIQQHAEILAVVTFSMLFLSKALAIIDALLTKDRCRRFGGFFQAVVSVLIECLVSIFVAPIFMICHSRFVVSTALGKGIVWNTQNRNAGDGMPFSDAVRNHWELVVIGGIVAFVSSRIDPYFFWWLSPVWGGLIFSPMTSYLLSKPSIGRGLERSRLLMSPEEVDTKEELIACKKYTKEAEELGEESDPMRGFRRALIDPYINAIRVSIAQSNPVEQGGSSLKTNWQVRLLWEGAESLEDKERKEILNTPSLLEELYQTLWTIDPKDLHESWKNEISAFSLRMPIAST